MHFDSPTTQTLYTILAILAGLVLLAIGFWFGRALSRFSHRRTIAVREQELFTAQKGFKALYEHELNHLRSDNEKLKNEAKTMAERMEELRKKAAGFGGLFSNSRRSEAMYALLLENEALEDALHIQNEKLREERVEALKEQRRSTGYRRILISQLLNDRRIKSYMDEIAHDSPDQHRLPAVSGPQPRETAKAADPDQT